MKETAYKKRVMAGIYLIDGQRWLLLERLGSRVVQNGSYTGTAGGHFEPEELSNPYACILRELKEETGLTENDIEDLSLRYICLRNKDGEIRENHYFFARLKDPRRKVQSNEGNLVWIDEEKLLSLPMPHSARAVVEHYLRTGRHTDCLYGGIATKSGMNFTQM